MNDQTINLKKINKQWVDLEKSLDQLGDKFGIGKFDYFQSFANVLSNISINFERVVGGIQVRQGLMDTQCNRRIFHGFLHEQYHEACNVLEADLDNFFSTIKTGLNRFVKLIYEVLPHERRRDLKPKSFGSFLKSLEKVKFDSTEFEELRGVILSVGKPIDEKINEYRNKHIEHIQTAETSGLVSFDGSIRKLHHKSFHKDKQNQQLGNGSFGNKDDDVLVVKVGENKFVYYIHIKPRDGLRTGVRVKKGEKIGHAADGDSGHFGKYGPHCHIFTSPGLQHDPGVLLNLKRGFLEFSPEPVGALMLVSEYFEKVLGKLLKI